MKKVIFILAIVFLHFGKSSAQDIIPNKIIFRVAESYQDKCKSNIPTVPELNQLVNQVGTSQKKYPRHKAVDKSQSHQVDLSTLYELELSPGENMSKVLSKLRAQKSIVYAEPLFQNYLTYTPNDSLINQQYYLNAVKAYQAWDTEKGDSTVVIAITDTGTDLDHPDLINQLALNLDDPINGLDDDNDGYVDNYYGWNTASDNNNVSFENSGHGTNVAGITCSEVDNNFGLAGVGFNTRFLTVRIDLPNGFLRNTYEAIVYAADQGADIINCSWGSNGFSQYGQDIIDYATYNKGALVVAGAGNFGNEIPFYPAAYKNVIAVGSTIEGDTVKAESNYGTWLQLFAPGDNILTTNVIGGFGTNGGTSMAAPIVAGIAALVKSKYPSYGPQQIAQQLYNTADNIEGKADPKYQGKTGYGLVNAFRAVTETNKPGIDLVSVEFADEEELKYTGGDTVSIKGSLVNFLSPATNVSISLEPQTDKFTIITGSQSWPAIASLDSAFFNNNPLQIVINPGLNYNEIIELKFNITADGYSNTAFERLSINKDYITLKENEIRATYTSSGGIGFSGPFANFGNGISWLSDQSILYEGGLAIGNSSFYMVDKFRNDQNGVDEDFSISMPITIQFPKKANVELQARFNDGNFSNPQGLDIIQHNYIFRGGEGKQSIIYVYQLSNNGFIDLNNLYAGIMMDWDINDYSKNKITYDSTRRMGISYASDSNLFACIKLLSQDISVNHYAMDNMNGVDPQINPSNGLNDSEKFHLLSTKKNQAGMTGAGNDIIDILSAGPFNLKKDSSISVSFLISIGDSLDLLKRDADSLQEMFTRLSLDLIETKLISEKSIDASIYPNPGVDQLKVEFYLNEPDLINFKVYDQMGRIVIQNNKVIYPKGRNLLQFDISSLKTGVYFFSLKGEKLKFENTFVKSSN